MGGRYIFIPGMGHPDVYSSVSTCIKPIDGRYSHFFPPSSPP